MLSNNDLANWNALEKIVYGCSYDENYSDTDDVELLYSLIGGVPKNILDVCCGTGRMLIPLAKAGHNMTGFDCHIGMLARLHEKAKGLTNIKYYYADAISSEWESNFDVVLLAFNVIQNID